MTESLFRHSSGQMAAARNYADWTRSLFEPYVAGDVLEVGCGVGIYTEQILRRCAFRSLLSIDLSSDSVAHCRSRIRDPRVEFRCTDVQDVAGAFDTVVCMNVLEHIEDDRAALRHMWLHLRPGGTLFLLVPAHRLFFTPWDSLTGHFRRYDKKRLRRLIGEATGGEATRVRQFYFNAVGGLGHWVIFGLLGKMPRKSVEGEIGTFDRWVVPVMRRVEGRHTPFGISLVAVMSKEPRADARPGGRWTRRATEECDG